MKIKNITNVEEFFKVVDSCEGKVELHTKDGDVLNLKSKLCQYVSLVSIFSNETFIPELELKAENEADVAKLFNYMMRSAQ